MVKKFEKAEWRRKIQGFLMKKVIFGIFSVIFVLLAGCNFNPGPDASPVAKGLAKLLPSGGKSPRQKIFDHCSSTDPDQRRKGVRMLGEGAAPTWPGTPEILNIMAKGDPDALVRAAAVQTLAQIGKAGANVDTLEKTSRDESPLVRQETMRALKGVEEEPAGAILRERLAKDTDSTVRALAAERLREHPGSPTSLALIEAVEDADHAVAFRARESLRALASQDFGYNRQEWLTWLAEQK